jgi:dolichyl-phosphate-mannose--protein O-mannosyl transferase
MACITALMIFTLAAFTYTGVCCTLTAQSVPQLFSGNLELLQTHLHPALHHRYESSGWSWPLLLRPIWFGIEPTGTTARGTICIGNPVVFLVVLVVIPLLSARGVRRLFLQGNITLTATLLPVVGFFANWLPWCMLSERRGFIYYYLPSLIFGCMAYATAISLVPAKNRWITWILLVVPTLTSVAVCVLYLPLYLGLEVPFEWMLTLLPFEAWW